RLLVAQIVEPTVVAEELRVTVRDGAIAGQDAEAAVASRLLTRDVVSDCGRHEAASADPLRREQEIHVVAHGPEERQLDQRAIAARLTERGNEEPGLSLRLHRIREPRRVEHRNAEYLEPHVVRDRVAADLDARVLRLELPRAALGLWRTAAR